MAGGLAIVLSGGGAKGAFQVGVLDALITQHKVSFETAVGTSTGSIQAAAVAQDDIPALINFWTGIKGPDDIYKKRGGTFLDIITKQPSLYATEPLQKLLATAIDDAKIKASGKKLRIVIVNITNGQMIPVGENATDIAKWVYASCAMPFAFPPQPSTSATGVQEQWVDGGVRDVTPLDTAMKERPRAILVVRAGAAPKPDKPKQYKDLVAIGLRAVDIQHSEVSANDLKNVKLINELITIRDNQIKALKASGLTGAEVAVIMKPFVEQLTKYEFVPVKVIEPKEDLYDTLTFDHKLIGDAMNAGRKLVNDNWAELKAFLGV
jgi:NTE family protein